VTFKTESGSVYRINYEKMTWERLNTGDPKHTSRKNSGNLVARPGIEIGRPAFLQDDDILPGCITHFVQTTEVTEIIEP